VTFLGWDDYGHLHVEDKGKKYTYFGVHDFVRDELSRLLKKGRVGEVWNRLDEYSRPELAERD